MTCAWTVSCWGLGVILALHQATASPGHSESVLRGPNICNSELDNPCCEGWIQFRGRGACVKPICENGCGTGHCLSPNVCICKDGRKAGGCTDSAPVSHKSKPRREHRRVSGRRKRPDTCEKAACSHSCREGPAGAVCICNPGYRLGRNKRTCRDLNECKMLKNPCSHRCANTPGSFRCTCPSRHILNADGRTCRQVEGKRRPTPEVSSIPGNARKSSERSRAGSDEKPRGRRRRPRPSRARFTIMSLNGSDDRESEVSPLRNMAVVGHAGQPPASRSNLKRGHASESRGTTPAPPVADVQGDTKSHMEVPGLAGEPPIGPIHKTLRPRKTPWDYAWYDESRSRQGQGQQQVHIGGAARGRLIQAPPSGHMNPANSNQGGVAGPCRRGQGWGPGGCVDSYPCGAGPGPCDDRVIRPVPSQPDVVGVGCGGQGQVPVDLPDNSLGPVPLPGCPDNGGVHSEVPICPEDEIFVETKRGYKVCLPTVDYLRILEEGCSEEGTQLGPCTSRTEDSQTPTQDSLSGIRLEECEPRCENGGTCLKGACVCEAGLKGDQCQDDIDECKEKTPCSHFCQNSFGSFTCSCPPGLKLHTDGATCIRKFQWRHR